MEEDKNKNKIRNQHVLLIFRHPSLEKYLAIVKAIHIWLSSDQQNTRTENFASVGPMEKCQFYIATDKWTRICI